MVLSLPENEVHLWLVFESEVPDTLLAKYQALLSADERQRGQRFHFERDRRRHLITRALVRTVLSRYSSSSPESWRFAPNEYGRPLLVNGNAILESVSFNISHTDGLIICGVSRRHTIGVDVENTLRKTMALEVADRTFSPEESTALRALPAYAQTARFFHYWTLKESYIKAMGKGLSIPLEDFTIDLVEPRGVSIAFNEPLRNSSLDCRFWLLQASREHVCAVCVEHSTSDSRQHLILKKVVPLAMEESYECPVLRHSGAGGMR